MIMRFRCRIQQASTTWALETNRLRRLWFSLTSKMSSRTSANFWCQKVKFLTVKNFSNLQSVQTNFCKITVLQLEMILWICQNATLSNWNHVICKNASVRKDGNKTEPYSVLRSILNQLMKNFIKNKWTLQGSFMLKIY